MSKLTKAIQNPKLAINVLQAKYRKQQLSDRAERYDCASRLAEILSDDVETLRAYHREVATNADLQESLFDRYGELHSGGELSGNTSRVDAEVMYVACRSLEPRVVVETGVLYGSYDAHILAALEKNGVGELHSIDLPGQPSEQFDYGHLIPDEYRDRWELHLGDASEILEDVCEAHQPDAFLHDSLHREDHMRFEYQTAYGFLPNGGVLASHDVLLSDVFQSFARENGMSWTRIRNTGVAVK